ncbi:hypothetical protein H8959_007231 [Pygathrix nigripes]
METTEKALDLSLRAMKNDSFHQLAGSTFLEGKLHLFRPRIHCHLQRETRQGILRDTMTAAPTKIHPDSKFRTTLSSSDECGCPTEKR